jgi:hypothetical protein
MRGHMQKSYYAYSISMDPKDSPMARSAEKGQCGNRKVIFRLRPDSAAGACNHLLVTATAKIV